VLAISKKAAVAANMVGRRLALDTKFEFMIGSANIKFRQKKGVCHAIRGVIA
jgi:hypothetical protein